MSISINSSLIRVQNGQLLRAPIPVFPVLPNWVECSAHHLVWKATDYASVPSYCPGSQRGGFFPAKRFAYYVNERQIELQTNRGRRLCLSPDHRVYSCNPQTGT